MIKNNSVSKLFDLKDKTVILTGSAGRLGTEYAHILSSAGANVVLVDVDKRKNNLLKDMILEEYGTMPSSYVVDIANENAVKQMTRDILKKYKKIDALINNAFFNPSRSTKSPAPFEGFPLDLWNAVIDVNLTGVFLCSREVGQVMVKQGKGTIVNISSIYGMVGADQRIYGKSKLNSPVSYAVTKGAIINLTRYLAAYWHRKNIRVNTLSLGGVLDKAYMDKEFIKKYSEKTMLGRMANKDEYNGAMLFLISDASSYMTGANLVVDGGWTSW